MNFITEFGSNSLRSIYLSYSSLIKAKLRGLSPTAVCR
jgi:hypothetical protein